MKPVVPEGADEGAMTPQAHAEPAAAHASDTRHLGSLFGTIDHLIRYITLARAVGTVKVWIDGKCDVLCGSADSSVRSSDQVIGIYDAAATIDAIRADLVTWRTRRASSDVRCLPIRWFVDRDT